MRLKKCVAYWRSTPYASARRLRHSPLMQAARLSKPKISSSLSSVSSSSSLVEIDHCLSVKRRFSLDIANRLLLAHLRTKNNHDGPGAI